MLRSISCHASDSLSTFAALSARHGICQGVTSLALIMCTSCCEYTCCTCLCFWAATPVAPAHDSECVRRPVTRMWRMACPCDMCCPSVCLCYLPARWWICAPTRSLAQGPWQWPRASPRPRQAGLVRPWSCLPWMRTASARPASTNSSSCSRSVWVCLCVHAEFAACVAEVGCCYRSIAQGAEMRPGRPSRTKSCAMQGFHAHRGSTVGCHQALCTD